MHPDLRLDQARDACKAMVYAGVVTRNQDGSFAPTRHIRTEAEFQRYQRERRRAAALARLPFEPPMPVPDRAKLRAVNAVLMAEW